MREEKARKDERERQRGGRNGSGEKGKEDRRERGEGAR